MSPSSTSSSEQRVLEGRDGLIPVPDRVLEGRARRVIAIAIVSLFLIVLAGTGLIDTFLPGPVPILEGQEADEDAARRRVAKFSDGTLASLFEYDRRLTSSVRRTVLAPYSRSLYKWFRFAKREVIVGDDGWMFLRVRSELRTLTPEDATEQAALRLATLDRALAARGTRLVVAPIPRKPSVYQNLLPLGADCVPELESLFEEALERHGITYAPVRERYEEYLASPEAVDGDPLYFKIGTHWTPRAELITAEAIARVAGLLKTEDERRSTIVTKGKKPQDTDNFIFAGMDSGREADARLAGAKPIDNLRLVGPKVRGLPFGASPKKIGRIALAGTSFSAKRQMPQFLSHFTQIPVYNAARPGTNPIATVLEVLKKSEPGKPRILVLELPGHCAYLNENLRRVEDIYAEAAPTTVHPLPLGSSWKITAKDANRAPIDIGRNTRLAALSTGSIAHDGGGILAVRIRGTLRGSAVRITVMSGSERTATKWTPGSEGVMVPLMASGASSPGVTVYAQRTGKGATLELEGLELVATFARDDASPGSIQAVDAESALVTFKSRAPLARHATLVVQLSTSERDGPIMLAAEVDGTWHELGEFDGLVRRGTILASLAGHAGGVLTRVRATGLSAEQIGEAYIAPALAIGN